MIAELVRTEEDRKRLKNWRRWGTYLPERQWGTVREDYSEDNNVWRYFTHDHARSRTYRWGEDGLLGFTDRGCRLCVAPAIWNHKDNILKERLFGLTSHEGNHGEDVKEVYFYLDATPTSSYCKALYKYPQAKFPYQALVDKNRPDGKNRAEFELFDTGIFNSAEYFDLVIEYAKAAPEDILFKYTIINRAQSPAPLSFLPNIWFRNTWAWDLYCEKPDTKPWLKLKDRNLLSGYCQGLGNFELVFSNISLTDVLFTENETNTQRLYGRANHFPYTKDAFHRYVCDKLSSAVNPLKEGTKTAPLYQTILKPGSSLEIRMRLRVNSSFTKSNSLGKSFDQVLSQRKLEADEFYNKVDQTGPDPQHKLLSRQAYAGLFWSRQFYHYIVNESLSQDDLGNKATDNVRLHNPRNKDWQHVYSKDIILMPDKWEYPWFAAWDLAFHTVALAKADPDFAKQQLSLFLREWYMHPNGQLPAYEFSFSDVNPPVHAWAAMRIYKLTGKKGKRDRVFLEGVFQKLLLNFTWWVNKKDPHGNNLFAGGFLGLDNIGIFDRGADLPTGGYLQQADGTAWMAFYCLSMLDIALELAHKNPVYEDMASKFFEHFVAISDAINNFGGTGLWEEDDGFYYDHIAVDNHQIALKTRSLVGLLPIIAVIVLDEQKLKRFPGFTKRMNWFLTNRSDIAKNSIFAEKSGSGRQRLLAIPSKERLIAVLSKMLDEQEFLSGYGVRSLSRFHKQNPYKFEVNSKEYKVEYLAGEGDSTTLGGNSNWRGPIWFPINFLLIEALERYDYFFGDSLKLECPSNSGKFLSLKQIASEISRRLCSLFLPGSDGRRPCFGDNHFFRDNPDWKDLLYFHEYFNAETGAGLGSLHQTGWTALVTRLLGKSMR